MVGRSWEIGYPKSTGLQFLLDPFAHETPDPTGPRLRYRTDDVMGAGRARTIPEGMASLIPC